MVIRLHPLLAGFPEAAVRRSGHGLTLPQRPKEHLPIHPQRVLSLALSTYRAMPPKEPQEPANRHDPVGACSYCQV
jgi:hypothetical protein